MSNKKLPEGITEEEATLLVQGAQRYLQDGTLEPAPDEELFYGSESKRDGGARAAE